MGIICTGGCSTDRSIAGAHCEHSFVAHSRQWISMTALSPQRSQTSSLRTHTWDLPTFARTNKTQEGDDAGKL